MISYAKKIICTRCGRIDYLDSDNKQPSSYTHIECEEIEPISAFGKTINEVDLCSTCYGDFVHFIMNPKNTCKYYKEDKK